MFIYYYVCNNVEYKYDQESKKLIYIVDKT